MQALGRVNGGQAVFLIVIIIAAAILALAVVLRVFSMAPAYVMQRSIYYVFKYDPSIVAKGLALAMDTVVMGFARNLSQYLINQGIGLYFHALVGWAPITLSLSNLIANYLNTVLNTAYEPMGLAILENLNYSVSYLTNYYGALGTGLKYVYAGGYSAGMYINLSSTYNMPTLGVYNLTLDTLFNLTMVIVKPGSGTCPGIIHTAQYSTSISCSFNFLSNSYTCTGPGFVKAGVANNLWAPDYVGYQQGTLTYGLNTGWSASSSVTEFLMLMYPIDELDGPAGFKVSMVFKVNSPTFLIGMNILSQYPSRSMVSGYSYFVNLSNAYFGAYGSFTPLFSAGGFNKPNVGDLENLTIKVIPQAQNPFNTAPTASAYIYLNGTQVGSATITLPSWNYVYSNAFGNWAYLFGGNASVNGAYAQAYGGLGSWVVSLIQGASLINASFKLYYSYVLPTNVYLAVSYNNAPAVGSTPLLYLDVPGSGLFKYPYVNYTVCNITLNAIIFNVTLPKPLYYPYYQLLLGINYSGVIILLNPWAPSSLAYYGLWGSYIPQGYSATSMGPYWLILYNTTTGSLTYLFPIWNGGSPTILSIFGGLYSTVYISSANYVYMGPVLVPPQLNIYNPLLYNYTKYTFNELLIHLPTGYLNIEEFVKLPPGLPSPASNPNLIWEFRHFLNQTLPYTYFNYTIMDCEGSTASGNSYTNYALIMYSAPSNPYGILWAYYSTGNGGQPC